MAIQCVLSLSDRVEERRLARAVRLALDAEPILGCRLVDRWFRPFWQRDPAIDDLPYFAIRTTSDPLADMQVFIDAPPDCPLQALLLRGESDVLCIKLDHRVGDGKALLDCAYLVADIYNRLGDLPDYRPVPNAAGDRSLKQIAERFSAREKWRVARHVLKASREIKQLGQWRYPMPRQGQLLEFDYVCWRLDAEQVRALFTYGARQRATISQVLLAAFYLAAFEVLPRSPDAALPVHIAVDLRRYLPSARASAFCNLAGSCVIAIDTRSDVAMDSVIRTIRDQMKSQQKYLGLANSLFALETLPVIRHLIGLIPFSRTKRSYRNEREQRLTQEFIPNVTVLTHAGDLDPDRLTFGSVEVVDGFAVAGVAKVPGILGLSVSGFKGSLTLYLGAGPPALVTRMAERIKALLPTGTVVAGKI